MQHTHRLNTFSLPLPAGIDVEELKQFVSTELWQSNPQLAIYQALKRINLLDEEDYLKRYPDVRESGVDPIYHYVYFGIAEEREIFFKEDSALIRYIYNILYAPYENIDLNKYNNLYNYFKYKKKNNKVIYTAIFGDYDILIDPEYKCDDIDYLCFSNIDIKSSVFTVIKVNSLFNDARLSARAIKILSHLFLSKYKFTLWIDGNIKIRGLNISKYMDQILLNDDIALYKHFQRNCIYEEANECYLQKKETYNNIKKLYNILKKNNYPKENGLVETGQLFRKYTQNVIRFNEKWWFYVKNITVRDQLSFNFVAYQLHQNYKILHGTVWLNSYCKTYLHKSLDKLIYKQPKVAIVILIHNALDITKQCIHSLLSKTNYNNFELILVDNNSNNDVKIFLENIQTKYNNIKIISNAKNLSFSIANNNATRSTDADYYLFLNNDTEIIDKNWLNILVYELISDNRIAAIGPSLLYSDYTIQSAGINVVKENDTIHMPATEVKFYRHSCFVDAISGACLLISKENFKKVNGFDIIYIYGQEDIDLCLKLREFRMLIKYCSETEIIHHESKTRKFSDIILQNREKIKNKWKHRFNKIPPFVDSRINYITYQEMTQHILTNFYKFDKKYDLIVGIPRSGMIPAYYLGNLFNIPVITLDELINNIYTIKSDRIMNNNFHDSISVLLIDDSINLGNAILRTINNLPNTYHKCHVIYDFCAIYASDTFLFNNIKIKINNMNINFFENIFYLKIIKQPRVFQWNYRNHFIANYSCYDIDGVLCVDPTEAENDDGDRYKQFLLNAKPLYIPNYKINVLVTTRLEKYRYLTEIWLKNNHIQYNKLFMLDVKSKEERIKYNLYGQYKGEIYKQQKNTLLFIESNPNQAKEIAKISGKPVLCIANDLMYRCE